MNHKLYSIEKSSLGNGEVVYSESSMIRVRAYQRDVLSWCPLLKSPFVAVLITQCRKSDRKPSVVGGLRRRHSRRSSQSSRWVGSVWSSSGVRGSQRSGARSPSLLQYQAERQAKILVSSVALCSKAVRHFQLWFFYVYCISFDTNSCREAACDINAVQTWHTVTQLNQSEV